ncbi:MAG TPA: DUF4288 domain-containing protein, partial [Isosphaeraceae bacterium]|nr:DUF4288 domain-containing protein [Isosphaeraceae bacterium]
PSSPGSAEVPMGDIPPDACWYLADLVMEFLVEGDARNVVHINIHLIRANSPQEAHARALTLGHESEQEFENTDGRLVRVLFRGLRDLNVIHDPLEDGAELIYEERIDVPEEQLQTFLTPRDSLGVFAPRSPRLDGPNYLPHEFRGLLDAQETTDSEPTEPS